MGVGGGEEHHRIMLSLLLVISSAQLALAAAPVDANCSAYDSVTSKLLLTPLATSCKDKYSLDVCKSMYGKAATAATVALAEPKDRVVTCFTAPADTWNEDLKTKAIADCPAYCGYCCLTEEYKCSNTPNPRLTCDTVTNAMCQSVLWREQIAQYCPNKCGFCALGGCIDAAPDCATQPTICYTLEAWAATNCKRTCGKCDGANSSTVATTIAGGSTCGNTQAGCAAWVKNGFCTSTFYTAAQKRQYCGVSCNLC